MNTTFSIWRIFRNSLAVVGAIGVFGAIGTSDYYVMEQGIAEPAGVGKILIISLLMLLPMAAHLFRCIRKEYKR